MTSWESRTEVITPDRRRVIRHAYWSTNHAREEVSGVGCKSIVRALRVHGSRMASEEFESIHGPLYGGDLHQKDLQGHREVSLCDASAAWDSEPKYHGSVTFELTDDGS
jgi:hypothetical protein